MTVLLTTSECLTACTQGIILGLVIGIGSLGVIEMVLNGNQSWTIRKLKKIIERKGGLRNNECAR